MQNWKLDFIMALFDLLAYIENPSNNKGTSEKYQFDCTEKQIGMVAIVVIIISLCTFMSMSNEIGRQHFIMMIGDSSCSSDSDVMCNTIHQF